MNRSQPQLFIDFVLEGESLYLRFANFSDIEAYQVSVKFSQPILALNQSKDLTKIKLFQQLTYFAPQKEFTLYIDEISHFLSSLQEDRIRINIQYRNAENKIFKKKITHDLSIYQDLPIIIKP